MRESQTTAEDAAQELAARGIVDAEALLRFASPDAIVGACRWFDSLGGNPGAGVLASAVKAGGKLDWQPPRPRRTLDEQKDYGERIADWLTQRMPDVCKVDKRIVEWHWRLYGEDQGRRLQESRTPHPAAIAMVIRLHAQHGKRSLTVREHGPQIRDAVKHSDEEAIADYEAIAAERENTQPSEVSQ